jgi:hypothetical protein
MKSSFKDFDYKGFFIQYGEKIGLWAAVGITALLLIFVIKDVFAGRSAGQNAKLLNDLSAEKDRSIKGSVPDPKVKVVPTDIKEGATPQPVDPSLYAANIPFFSSVAQEDKKWRSPTVLGADDFKPAFLQVQVPSYLFEGTGDNIKVGVLSPAGDNEKIRTTEKERKKAKMTPRQRRIEELRQQLQSGGGMGMGMGMGMRGGGGPGGMGMMGMRGGGPGGGMMGMMGGGGGRMGMMGMAGMMGGSQMMNNMTGMGNAYAMGGGSGGTELKVSFVKYEDSDKYPEWAHTMLPYRMVIVTGAFPLKQEMETFRQALRFQDVGKMLDQADFEFSGLSVERREAKTVEELQKKEWYPLDVETNLKVVMMKAVDKEPDDPRLKSAGLILDPNRIFMPLPKLETELHKDNKYPEDLLPSSIQEALAAIEKAGKPAATSKKRQSRFKGIGSYDLWGEDEGSDGQAAATPAPSQDTPARDGTLSNEPTEPEKCPLRFVDVAVRPGMVYEYRIKVRMVNPNYHKPEKAVTKTITEDAQIIAREWTVIPQKVKIPEELLFFAAEDKRSDAVMPADRVPVQVQYWLEKAQTDLKNSSSEFLVGEWSVLEKVMAHRGEYIGEVKEVEIPVWLAGMKKFLFAVPPEEVKKAGGPRRMRHKGIPVDFNTGAVLVDFEGGKRYYPLPTSKPVLDEGPVELLVLSPDGKKLLVRNSRADTQNEERKKHLEEWKSIQEKVKEEVENLKGGGKGDNLRQFIGNPGKQ